jgi:Zn-dependent metalloprotease
LFKYNKLSLSKESGAMNKAFSDIWGACVEYYAAPSKSTWLIGEDIMMKAALPEAAL